MGGYKVALNYFGVDRKYPLRNGNNLGKLTKTQLRELYYKSDFGVVASMTNVSLVPYEMIASGLPVIDFEDGSYSSFLPSDSAILTGINFKSLASRMIELIESPDKLVELTKYSKKFIEKFSWKKTSEEFYLIIRNLVDEEK